MQQDQNNENKLPSQVTTQLISDLKEKFGVDEQEVLNAVIAADNDRAKAEEYLRERTTKR